jgi:hypothetical protein
LASAKPRTRTPSCAPPGCRLLDPHDADVQFTHESTLQLQRMEHAAQFMDLVAACGQFVATAGGGRDRLG